MAATVSDGRRDDIATVTLAAGDLEATFAPDAGMVCCSVRHRGEELLGQRRGLAEYAARGKTMGIPLLHPWANLLGDFTYEALGRRVDLHGLEGTISVDGETGLPIHGTLPGRWSVVSAEPNGAEGARLVAEREPFLDDGFRAAFPFDHRLRIVAELDGAALRLRTSVLPVSGPVPVSFGFHPYFTLPDVPREEYGLELPVQRHLVLDDKKLPTGDSEPVQPFAGPLGDRAFDDGYDELEQPPVFALEGGGRRIEVHFEDGYPFAQVFAPEGMDVVCFEPMTALTDALRRGTFAVATPSEPYTAAFSMVIS
jgi:aldose 1-epimerase